MANVQAGAGRSSIAWLLFALKGRASRQSYWLALLLQICVNGVLIGQLVGGDDATFGGLAAVVSPIMMIATVYSNLAVTVKRLHDIGYSGFLALAIFVPLVNIFFTIWVGVVPGTPGPNVYGEAPDSAPA